MAPARQDSPDFCDPLTHWQIVVPNPSRTSPVRDPAHDTGAMRNVTSTEAPSLFTPELFDGTESLDIVVAGAEKSPEILARNFVRWCWSFGTEFRNSPDITNLRSWLRNEKAGPVGG